MPKSPSKKSSGTKSPTECYELILGQYTLDEDKNTFDKGLKAFLKKASELRPETKIDTLKKAKKITAEQQTAEQQLVEAVEKINSAILIAEAEAQAKAAAEAKEAAEAQAASNYTALGVSAIIGIIASIYSQTLQNMLFGKILFGKAVLFGYALPVANLAIASVMFGLVVFGLGLAVISTAKFIEGNPLFSSITQTKHFKYILSTLLIIVPGLALTKYAVAIQLVLFGKIFLGGTILANLCFAFIPTVLIGILVYTVSYNPKYFNTVSTLYTFAAGSLFASPILQALAGIVITGSALVVIASSIAVGAAAALTFGLIYGAEKAKESNPSYGFGLTIYAVSFVLLSIYASPIQIALFGHTIMFVTPMFSNISFGAVASIFTSTLTTLLYKKTEEIAIPALIPTYAKAGSFKTTASNFATGLAKDATSALESICKYLGCTS